MASTPTGAPLLVQLSAWRQADDGGWWGRCSLSLWSPVTVDGATRAEPYDVVFWAPAGRLEKLPGEDYRRVPRTRSRAVIVRRGAGRSPRRDSDPSDSPPDTGAPQ